MGNKVVRQVEIDLINEEISVENWYEGRLKGRETGCKKTNSYY